MRNKIYRSFSKVKSRKSILSNFKYKYTCAVTVKFFNLFFFSTRLINLTLTMTLPPFSNPSHTSYDYFRSFLCSFLLINLVFKLHRKLSKNFHLHGPSISWKHHLQPSKKKVSCGCAPAYRRRGRRRLEASHVFVGPKARRRQTKAPRGSKEPRLPDDEHASLRASASRSDEELFLFLSFFSFFFFVFSFVVKSVEFSLLWVCDRKIFLWRGIFFMKWAAGGLKILEGRRIMILDFGEFVIVLPREKILRLLFFSIEWLK